MMVLHRHRQVHGINFDCCKLHSLQTEIDTTCNVRPLPKAAYTYRTAGSFERPLPFNN